MLPEGVKAPVQCGEGPAHRPGPTISCCWLPGVHGRLLEGCCADPLANASSLLLASLLLNGRLLPGDSGLMPAAAAAAPAGGC